MAGGQTRGRTGPRGAASRDRIAAAAAAEFAARGFDGTPVDRIAARARVNKAMIYYHFRSKAGLYREILRELFRTVAARVRAIADGPAAPDAKIAAFIDALATEAGRRPHLPPIMLRELAERGRHLDPDTLALLHFMPHTFATIVGQGVSAGHFRRADPLLAYHSIVGPVVFYFASEPVRSRMTRMRLSGVESPGLDALVAHIQTTVLGLLRREQP